MHLGLLAAMSFDWLFDLYNWGLIAQVAVGLGMVIFVHELGHFLVAKACGVKCEKFYLGFDIFGLKLARFQWGETEYGIGILPLGGYVKMLGQEDNPVKAAEELERARIAHSAPAGAEPAGEASGTPKPAPETSVFDPRSYLAKSVPKRMAIISAGVIMNVIFAFAMAVVAYRLGVRENPCVVGAVLPGDPAWKAGLRPGDEIVRIGDVDTPRFRDLQSGVALGSKIDDGVKFVVRRPGEKELLDFTLTPDRSGLAPRIGILSQGTTALSDPPISPVAPLGQKDEDPFKPGDVVTAVGGVPVTTNAEIRRELARHPGPIAITISRPIKDGSVVEEIELPGRPLKRLGLVMELGPIKAVQADSPATAAGLTAGDVIEKIDGEPVGDPETLSDRLLARVGETVTFAVRRDGKTVDVPVTPREPYAFERTMVDKEPLAINSLGIAITITNRVADVLADSPAAKAGIPPGATVTKATVLPPEKTNVRGKGTDVVQDKVEINFAADKPNWPVFFDLLQSTLPGTTVKLSLGDEREVTLAPMLDAQHFFADRGLQFEPAFKIRRAESFGQAMQFAGTETVDSVGQVYRFLRAIGRQQVSVKGMAGPLGILQVAHQSASKGFSDLLIFLTMLSANLAVLNFLPIPLLDGGHMVFLTLEGIRGKPVSERVVLAFHYAGFFFIIGLMAFVFLLDLGFISRTT